MAHPYFFLCPNCFSEESLSKSGCTVCHSSIHVDKDSLACNGRKLTIAQYYQFLLDKLPVHQETSVLAQRCSKMDGPNLPGVMRASKKAVLRQGSTAFNFAGYHGLFTRKIEKPQAVGSGYLLIFEDRVEFLTVRKSFRWQKDHFTCVTTNGHYFEFKINGEPFFQIHFPEESALKYEIIFRKWLDTYPAGNRSKRIIEYQPKLRPDTPQPGKNLWKISGTEKKEKPYFFEKLLVGAITKSLKWLMRAMISLEIHGRENWRKGEKGFVLINHQSALDPFIIGTFWDHRIAFLTKSTAFVLRIPRLFLKWGMGLPTTRYQTDPQVIPIIKFFLSRGVKVGIFPEGERCWDGKMQSFKLSLVKILMASREAVYLIILENAFQFWPRWAKFPRRAKVKMSLQAPFCLLPDIYSVDEQRRFLENQFRVVLKEL